MKILSKSRKVSNVLKDPVAFYCKDCEEIVEAKPVGRKFVYRCAKCNTKNVAFGTENAVKNYYRIKDGKDEGKVKEKSEIYVEIEGENNEELKIEDAGKV